MLTWIAAVFAGLAPTRRHLQQRGDVSINGLAMLVKKLILVRAADFSRVRRNRPLRFFKYGRDLRRRSLGRSVIGSHLRRALNHRDPIQRIAILLDALMHLDVWAKRFAKRLRARLTRLFPIAPAPMPAETLINALARTPACVDSS